MVKLEDGVVAAWIVFDEVDVQAPLEVARHGLQIVRLRVVTQRLASGCGSVVGPRQRAVWVLRLRDPPLVALVNDCGALLRPRVCGRVRPRARDLWVLVRKQVVPRVQAGVSFVCRGKSHLGVLYVLRVVVGVRVPRVGQRVRSLGAAVPVGRVVADALDHSWELSFTGRSLRV